MKRKLLILLTLSAALRSLAEIGKWRADWSWLPLWFFEYRNPLMIDPYHIVSNAHWVVMFIAGIYYARHRVLKRRWWALADLALVWAFHGLANNVFYHWLWMRPEYWFK